MQSQVVVYESKGEKDALTMLPASLVEPLKAQIPFVEQQHERDLANGCGSVELPYAVARKYSNADLANINRPVSPHTFRHCFATHFLEAGYDIRTVQELLGQKGVKTTMVTTQVLNRGPKAVRAPLDV